MTVQKMDNLHIDFSPVLGTDKTFIAIISPREPGKTTVGWHVLWNDFINNGNSHIVFRRYVNDVSEIYIEDSLKTIKKFKSNFDIKKIHYKRGQLKDGIVDVFYGDRLFFRLIALAKKLSKLKSLMIENLHYMFFDEFICNPRADERYLKSEAFKFKEVFNTFQREQKPGTPIRVLLLGNPYSLYNPYFSWWGVDTSKLKPGVMLTGDDWIVWCYELKSELKEFILKRNPLYKFDDSYTSYAFDGMAINDSNIRVSKKQPVNYKLTFAVLIEGKYIGVFRNTRPVDFDTLYYVRPVDEVSTRKSVYCFDFKDLVDNSMLVSNEERIDFYSFKSAFRKRQIVFHDIESYYLIEDVYKLL